MKRLARSIALLVLSITALICLGSFTFTAVALAGPVWSIDSLANTTVAPGATLDYLVETRNVGDASTDGSQISLVARLPAGLTAVSARLKDLSTQRSFSCFDARDGVSPVAGASSVICPNNTVVAAGLVSGSLQKLALTVRADPSLGADQSPPDVLTTVFTVSGGGASSAASTVDPTTVASSPPGFGVDAFDGFFGDAAGDPLAQAGGHPAVASVSLDFNTLTNSIPLLGSVWPVEPVKDVLTDLPAGLVGNPTAADQCTLTQLANNNGTFDPRPLCPATSQVGTTAVRIKGANQGLGGSNVLGPLPVFNLVPPPGVPATFGFNVLGNIVVLDASVRTGGDYGISVNATNLPEALAIVGTTVTFWGVPADPSHTPQRSCPGNEPPYNGGPTCSSGAPLRAFLRLPTSCTSPGVGLVTSARLDSWVHPGAYLPPVSWPTHALPGYPYARQDWGSQVGISGCDRVPFDPFISLTPTTEAADSPTGLDVHLHMPQLGLSDFEAIPQSDLRKAVVTLPEGMSVNPSAASGQGACTPAQIGLTSAIGASPIRFDESEPTCPNASKIGTATLTTPLLGVNDAEGNPVLDAEGNPVPRQLEGSVYLATQGDNPFGSLLAMYLVIDDSQSGVLLKLSGKIEADPATGRLTTTFDNNPQLPFSDLTLSLAGGSRAPLKTPASCGTYSANAALTGWNGQSAQQRSSFKITQGCGGGFDPKLDAGTRNPLAGDTSPFGLRITRQDTEQQLGSLTAKLPPGISGYLKGIPYCPDFTLASISGEPGTGRAQEANPSCPAASQVGTVTVGAGAGPTPFFTQSGRAYLAGPYKGAPLSLAVVTPAVAGPFDLGNVVVRNALRIDPQSAQITSVSDSLPTILHGIPLDLRDIRVDLSRDHFTLNPTSCEPMSIDSEISSSAGASASPSVHFQAAGCERLAFKPSLSLKLFGKPTRGSHPRLRATLSFPQRACTTKRTKSGKIHRICRKAPPTANLAGAQVALPHSEFLDQAHIRTICTRVQFAADACPPGSIYGYATAQSPIVDYPVRGPVYLRSSSHNLPDLVAALRGPPSQPVEVDAVARIDSVNGGIRSTFESTPDVPIDKVTLTMRGGAKGLIQDSANICAHEYKAQAQLRAQNNSVESLRPLVQSNKCASSPGRKPHKPHRKS